MTDFSVEAQPIVEKLKTLRLWQVDNYLTSNGFIKKFIPTSVTHVFISDKFVIKKPFIVARRPKFGKNIVPTIRFRIGNRWWSVQPKCDTDNSKKAFEVLRKHDRIDDWKDCSERNCGWYQGIPVIFDW